jgi:hypothetical protein
MRQSRRRTTAYRFAGRMRWPRARCKPATPKAPSARRKELPSDSSERYRSPRRRNIPARRRRSTQPTTSTPSVRCPGCSPPGAANWARAGVCVYRPGAAHLVVLSVSWWISPFALNLIRTSGRPVWFVRTWFVRTGLCGLDAHSGGDYAGPSVEAPIGPGPADRHVAVRARSHDDRARDTGAYGRIFRHHLHLRSRGRPRYVPHAPYAGRFDQVPTARNPGRFGRRVRVVARAADVAGGLHGGVPRPAQSTTNSSH